PLSNAIPALSDPFPLFSEKRHASPHRHRISSGSDPGPDPASDAFRPSSLAVSVFPVSSPDNRKDSSAAERSLLPVLQSGFQADGWASRSTAHEKERTLSDREWNPTVWVVKSASDGRHSERWHTGFPQ